MLERCRGIPNVVQLLEVFTDEVRISLSSLKVVEVVLVMIELISFFFTIVIIYPILIYAYMPLSPTTSDLEEENVNFSL